MAEVIIKISTKGGDVMVEPNPSQSIEVAAKPNIGYFAGPKIRYYAGKPYIERNGDTSLLTRSVLRDVAKKEDNIQFLGMSKSQVRFFMREIYKIKAQGK